MGYDCTLHAVDEKLISKDFVKVLLNGTVPTKGPVADAKLDEGFWKSVFEGFEKEKPSGAASLVCQLALVFASKSFPYHYERGFAISLWPELSEGLAAKFPEELTESPEVLFKDLVKARPELKGSFPNDFDGNWTTGRFIPAKNVPKALAWVETRVQKYDEGERDLFRGLILVLKHCAKHKLAYWEATDLPVPMAMIEAEGSDMRRKARSFQWPNPDVETYDQLGTVVLAKVGSVGSSDAYLVKADFSQWPPQLTNLVHGYPTEARISQSGDVVAVVSRPGTYYYRVCKVGLSEDSKTKPLEFETEELLGENGFDWACFFENRVVATTSFARKKTKKRFPLFQSGTKLASEKSFKPPNDNHSDYGGKEWLRHGVARTVDGTEVFVWRNEGFELKGHRFYKTFDLAASDGYDGFATVPCGNDGFYYLSNRMLFESHRGQQPRQHLTKLSNIMHLRVGPEGSLLLGEGDNKAGDLGKLYWPEQREVVSLKPTLLTDVPKKDFRTFYWIENKRILMAFTRKEVWMIPWSELKDISRAKIRN